MYATFIYPQILAYYVLGVLGVSLLQSEPHKSSVKRTSVEKAQCHLADQGGTPPSTYIDLQLIWKHKDRYECVCIMYGLYEVFFKPLKLGLNFVIKINALIHPAPTAIAL